MKIRLVEAEFLRADWHTYI